MSTTTLVSVPKWLEDLLNDVRLESTVADLIEVYASRRDITQEQARQLSHNFGVAYPYNWKR